jgi:hypothetical protein
MEVRVHAFSTSVLDGGEWTGGRNAASLDVVQNREKGLALAGNRSRAPLLSTLVTSHCAACYDVSAHRTVLVGYKAAGFALHVNAQSVHRSLYGSADTLN